MNSRVKIIVIGTIIFCTNIVFFLLGRFYSLNYAKEVAEPHSAEENLEDEEVGKVEESLEGIVEGYGEWFVEQEPIKRLSIQDIFGEKDPITRAFYFQKMLDSLSSEKAISLLFEIDQYPSNQIKKELTRLLYTKWGEVDGGTSFEYVRNLSDRDRLTFLENAAKGWARSDPIAAWRAMMDVTNNGSANNPRLGSILKEVAAKDVGLALNMLESCDSHRQDGKRFRAILESVTNTSNFSMAYDSILEVVDLDRKRNFAEELFDNWGQFNSNDALLAALGSENIEISDSAMKGLLKGWARVDGIGAFLYALENRDDPAIAVSLGDVVNEWGKSVTADELDGVVAVVDKSVDRNQILGDILRPISMTNPKLALKYAMTINDSQIMKQSITDIMGTWARSNLIEAEAHLYSMEDDTLQASAVKSMIAPMMSNDYEPERIYGLLEGIEDPEQLSSALGSLASAAKNSRDHEAADRLKGFLLDEVSNSEKFDQKTKNKLEVYLGNKKVLK